MLFSQFYISNLEIFLTYFRRFLIIAASEVSFVSRLKIFKGKSRNAEENTDTENNIPTNLETDNSYHGDDTLLDWFVARLEYPEVIEANKNLGDITLQFNAGGNLFYMCKSGVQTFKITSGRCSDPDALIRIPPEVESKLTRTNDFTEFFQEYKKYANLSGGDEYIKINYMRDMSQLSKKGILRSKLVRTLLMA